MQDVLLLQQIKITGNDILKSVNFLRVFACTRTPNEVCLFGDRIFGKVEKKSQIYSVSEVHTMSLGFLHKGFLMQLFGNFSYAELQFKRHGMPAAISVRFLSRFKHDVVAISNHRPWNHKLNFINLKPNCTLCTLPLYVSGYGETISSISYTSL